MGKDDLEVLLQEEAELEKSKDDTIAELEAEVQALQANIPEKVKFSWSAFFTMSIVIAFVLGIGFFVPGIIDEYIALLIVFAISGFLQANGFNAPNIKLSNIFPKK